jgi:hypothetical protein
MKNYIDFLFNDSSTVEPRKTVLKKICKGAIFKNETLCSDDNDSAVGIQQRGLG